MKRRVLLWLIIYSLGFSLFTGCSQPATSDPSNESEAISYSAAQNTDAPVSSIPLITSLPQNTAAQEPAGSDNITITSEPASSASLHDNTPYCPTPEAPDILSEGNEVTHIDYSNQSDGYIMIKYTGNCPKVKMIIVGPNSYKCTYDLISSDYQAFPLTAGNGSYSIGVYENIEGTSYATAYSMTLEANISDEFSPYLRPSQYVNYTADSYAVTFASELCSTAVNELDCISTIYNYIIENITYDHDKAQAATNGKLTGYLPEIDASLIAGKGICLDYAAIMTCMLRSQHIPTRLEVGYAGDVYHAWVSTYIKDIGWVNGIIQFDGQHWNLMDPTFGASTGEEELREFIGDGSNYTIKYIY